MQLLEVAVKECVRVYSVHLNRYEERGQGREKFRTEICQYPEFMTSSDKVLQEMKPSFLVLVLQAFKIFRGRINAIHVIET